MVGKILAGAGVSALIGVLTISAVSAVSGHGPVSLTSNSSDDQGKPARAADTGNDDQQGAVEQQQEGQTGKGEQQVAQAIATEFGVSVSDVMALHDQGIGFGAIFKLYAIAKAKGMSVNDLLASIQGTNGQHNFAFGKLINSLTDAQRAALESGPKSLGQLVSAAHENESAEGAATAQLHGHSK